ncbi:MAG TPA: PIG-L family deacetylase [Planctomycetota bacterium]|nr:PIG-L family deacetylase [Planctomycetota bacterium]
MSSSPTEQASPLPAPKVARPLTAPPRRGRVLVVAPHPDDEAIGPGATLLLHGGLGDSVDALFVTSGVHGDHRHAEDPASYVARRQAEARAAAAVLGVQRTEFWGYPDGMVVTAADLAAVTARLTELLARTRPDVIYAPHLGESHSDHHFVARAVQAAHRDAASGASLYGYEVWSPLDADLAVDVGAVYPRKLDAIRCYASQLQSNDIPRAVDGLNRYRAVLLPPGGQYAEVFVEWAGPRLGPAA